MTNLEAAYWCTDHIWDDREAYIMAIFKTFGIDPRGEFIDRRVRDHDQEPPPAR